MTAGDPVRADGALLRELHVILRQQDPGFGGLARVQDRRGRFLWVHPQYRSKY